MSKAMSAVIEDIRMESREEWMNKGIEQGKLDLMIGMVRDKIISIADAARRLNMTENEFLKLI